MKNAVLTAAKLLLVGFAATVVRIIGQLAIPAGEQSVLAPSVFALNGTMPLAFTVYGIFAYTCIAALFLLLRGRMGGGRLWQGLRYGLACCAVWVVYLWEPLPHVAALDRITYPIADSLALLVMGLLLGLLLGRPSHARERGGVGPRALPLLSVTLCFLAGRLIMYLAGIYSSFSEKTAETLLWCLLTGFTAACVMVWLNAYVPGGSRLKRALILGGALFGADLLLFNFFMPLVFDADIPDLILRTLTDTLAVTLGSLSLQSPPSSEKDPNNELPAQASSK